MLNLSSFASHLNPYTKHHRENSNSSSSTPTSGFINRSRSRMSLYKSPDSLSTSPRSISRLTRSSTPSPNGSHSDLSAATDGIRTPIILGICAMDVKARSKAMREIITRLVERARGAIDVKVFGDKVILDEGASGKKSCCNLPSDMFLFGTDVENWPRCDVLISFFSTDFPLDKAIQYCKLRHPFCINDLSPQALLWDRRLVGAVLDHLGVPTPRRLEVSRDGGPKVDDELRNFMKKRIGLSLGGFQVTPEVALTEDGDSIIIDGKVMRKPFVEKPVSGEDHNVYIYFPGGHGRRLFRKVSNSGCTRHGVDIANSLFLLSSTRLEISQARLTRLSVIRGRMAHTYTRNSLTLTTWRTSKYTLWARTTLTLKLGSHPSWTASSDAIRKARKFGMLHYSLVHHIC